MAGPSPWSLLPSVTHATSSDICSVVQGGVNVQLTHEAFLRAESGFGCFINAQGSAIVGCWPNGQAVVQSDAGQTAVIGDGLNNVICNPASGIHLINALGTIDLGDNTGGCKLTIAHGTVDIFLPVAGVMTCTFHPAHPGDWAGGVADLVAAINRIARVVSNNGATPIP